MSPDPLYLNLKLNPVERVFSVGLTLVFGLTLVLGLTLAFFEKVTDHRKNPDDARTLITQVR